MLRRETGASRSRRLPCPARARVSVVGADHSSLRTPPSHAPWCAFLAKLTSASVLHALIGSRISAFSCYPPLRHLRLRLTFATLKKWAILRSRVRTVFFALYLDPYNSHFIRHFDFLLLHFFCAFLSLKHRSLPEAVEAGISCRLRSEPLV